MLENQEVARTVLKEISNIKDSAEQLMTLSAQGDSLGFDQLAKHMQEKLQQLLTWNVNGVPLKAIKVIDDSLQRIILHARTRFDKASHKIEFELIPFLRGLYVSYYFSACVFPDKKLMEKYYQEEMVPLGSNKYLDRAVETGHYKYDLSISVMAFNKLEYTKLCIESLLRHIPQNVNYELILINHGSTDGTKEYFESIAPTKQMDILINGICTGSYSFIIEGKYFLEISNDVLVTENAIENMIRCMESDDRIAWVVPTTPNVSNLQTILADYKTIPEMHAFARKNNQKSDPYRWEQRVRLINPISLIRTSAAFSSYGVHWPYYIHTTLAGGFIDDKQSLFYRRNGYKMMLAKDAYCYHFGSVTLGEEIARQEAFYEKGRKIFEDAFGIDPWGPGFCWSVELMALLPCRDEGHVDILGLNCGLGSNPLKIKETLKENAHNLDVTLYNATDDKRYADDLRGISDVFEYEEDRSLFPALFPGVSFKYIVFESGWGEHPDPFALLDKLEKRLAAGGSLILQIADQTIKKRLQEPYPAATMTQNWCVIPAIGKSYSQYQEDWVIDALFKHKREGFYVDIGANDPEIFSNTRLFYGRGWSGINVEPDPTLHAKLCTDRQRDINLRVGVGAQPGVMTFYRMSADTLSSFNKQAALQAGKLYGATLVSEEQTPVLTLKDILASHLGGRQIDFLSVDAEGYDLSVLESNDWSLYRPSLIIVEINVGGGDIIKFLQGQGYILVFNNGTNGIFITREFLETIDIRVREDLERLEMDHNLRTVLPRTDGKEELTINVVYGHKAANEVNAHKRGNITVIWSGLPIKGCDHYVYHNAFSFRGRLPGLNILLMLEPTVVLPGEFDEGVWQHFDYIIGLFDAFVGRYKNYRKIRFPHFDLAAKPPTERPDMREALYPLQGRKNAVCMISGNKSSHVSGELYSKRLELARWFSQHSRIPFDVYGRPAFKLPNYRGEIPPGEKLEVLKQYRYSLCFENTNDPVLSAGYVTEKILDCLETRTVPIYLGASNIGDYIPAGCFIDYRAFEGPADLERYLLTLTEADYRGFVAAIDDWVAKGNLRGFSSQSFYDLLAQVCAEASAKSPERLYDGAKEWTSCQAAPPRHRTWHFVDAPAKWTWNQLANAEAPIVEDGKLSSGTQKATSIIVVAQSAHAGDCISAIMQHTSQVREVIILDRLKARRDRQALRDIIKGDNRCAIVECEANEPVVRSVNQGMPQASAE